MNVRLAFDTATASVDTGKRTITGRVVLYGVPAPSGGRLWQFAQGVLKWADVSRVKLWVGHDSTMYVGVATSLEDRPDGLYATFKVGSGADRDQILQDVADGILDGLSIQLRPDGLQATERDGVMHVTSAVLMEVSLTPAPAFDDARVTSVAASAAPTGKETPMPPEAQTPEAPQLDATGITGTIAGNVTITPEAPAAQASPLDPAALSAAVAQAVVASFSQAGVGTRQVIPAGGPAPALTINEPAPYRFDGTRGAHEFSSDLAASLGLGALNPTPNGEAYARVMRFMASELDPRKAPKFVTTTDTAAINPTGYRADMFVNEQRFTTPLYDAFYKGALTDATPFTFAKFNTATGLVGDHVQGTEPTGGTYTTATGATVTPAAVSGKIHITREVGDQGGNPQISALIWDKIQYEYRKAMENKVAAILGAATPNEFTNPAIAAAANTVAALADPITKAIAGLNFVAGGNRFNFIGSHLDLYLAMSGLKDGQSRPYFPIWGQSNSVGSATEGYQSLNVAGAKFAPVWSLGTVSDGTPHKSYLADTSSVWFWASAPLKLDKLQEKVEGWDLGVWGYQAGVISDPTGLLKITYDPV